jgi:hypothetical protein
MIKFLEALRNSVIITGALVLVCAFKIATTVLSVLIVAGAFLGVFIVTILLFIKEFANNLMGK